MKGVINMLTGFDLIECQHRKGKKWQMPFFTTRGWLLIAGVVGWIAGIIICMTMISPFLKQ